MENVKSSQQTRGYIINFFTWLTKNLLKHMFSLSVIESVKLSLLWQGAVPYSHTQSCLENPHWTFREKEKWFRKWQAIDRSVLFIGVSGLLKLYTLKNRVSGKTNVYALTCMEFSGPCLKRISIIWIISWFKVFVVDLVL